MEKAQADGAGESGNSIKAVAEDESCNGRYGAPGLAEGKGVHREAESEGSWMPAGKRPNRRTEIT